MFQDGFESPVLQGAQSQKAIAGFEDRGLFYIAESANPTRFTAKYLDTDASLSLFTMHNRCVTR